MGNGLWMPGDGHVDVILNQLNAADMLDCGKLDSYRDDALEKLSKVRIRIWKNVDLYVKEQSTPLMVQLAARSDAQATALSSEAMALAMKRIQDSTDQSLATDAIAAMQAFAEQIEIEEGMNLLPAALTSFSAADAQQRVDVERGLRTRGAVATLAGYKAVLRQGDPKTIAIYEDAAETYCLEVAREGTPKLATSARAQDRQTGTPTDEVAAANQLLALVRAIRADRKPTWLANAHEAYGNLLMATARLCGEHVDLMSPGASSMYWRESGGLPDPLSLAADWPTRWLRPTTALLPGYSPLIPGKGKRSPALPPGPGGQ